MLDPALLRITGFIGMLLACACWEYYAPRKVLTQNKALRWGNNLALVGANSLIMQLLMPFAVLDVAQFAAHHQLGLMNQSSLPLWLTLILSILTLDLAIYAQHRLFHRLPWLWRLHRMHHSDQDIDVTTGARFHPLEIWISLWWKIALVLSLGIPMWGVLGFELLLNLSAMFNHSNGKLSARLDAKLRYLIVTPDMHRVHHSTHPQEMHSNFGFFLAIWDHLFASYTHAPREGHRQMRIGLPLFRNVREQWLDKMLTQPFRRQ